MKTICKKHPIFQYAEDIKTLCKPLDLLDISYFSHVNIDNLNRFSAIANNPAFAEHYLQNEYYNADIHLANEQALDPYILWDALSITDEAGKMNQEASEFGVKHTFTIVEKNQGGSDFYHFSTHLNSNTINQVYLSNLDLLHKFIQYFKTQTQKSKELHLAYDYKYEINLQASGFSVNNTETIPFMNPNRSSFLNCLLPDNEPLQNYIVHKDTKKPFPLAPQQFKCCNLLLKGYSSKQIAAELNLSYRTVEHYLAHIKKLLSCKNNKELMITYEIGDQFS